MYIAVSEIAKSHGKGSNQRLGRSFLALLLLASFSGSVYADATTEEKDKTVETVNTSDTKE